MAGASDTAETVIMNAHGTCIPLRIISDKLIFTNLTAEKWIIIRRFNINKEGLSDSVTILVLK